MKLDGCWGSDAGSGLEVVKWLNNTQQSGILMQVRASKWLQTKNL